MGKITEILNIAQQRARQMDLPYEGALLPTEAYELMTTAPNAQLVDVRSRAEIDWVGYIPGVVAIDWLLYPGLKNNPHFIAQLEQSVDKEALVMFICRSGQRSHAAAAAAQRLGYNSCYNVLEGFEGDPDANGHRNTKNGWRAAGLPWKQG